MNNTASAATRLLAVGLTNESCPHTIGVRRECHTDIALADNITEAEERDADNHVTRPRATLTDRRRNRRPGDALDVASCDTLRPPLAQRVRLCWRDEQ